MTPTRVRPLLSRNLFLAFAAVVAVYMMWTYVGLLNESLARGTLGSNAAPAATPIPQIASADRLIRR